MRKYILLIFALSSFSLLTQAQDRVLAQMNTVPQSLDANPSAAIPYKFYIGMPLLNSFYIGLQIPFAYNDVVKRRADDSLYVDQKGFIDAQNNNRNLIFFENRIDILNFGFRIKKNFFTFSNSIRTALYFSYPKDMMRLLVYGNGQFIDENKSVDLKKLRVNGSAWSEIAVGYQRQLTPRINIGGRFKVLHGLGNVRNPNTDISLYTNPESYALTLAANAKGGFASPVDSAGNIAASDLTKNLGFSTDLGANYRFSDDLSVGVSVLDLGYIKWVTNPQTYSITTKNGSWTFPGLEFNRIFANNQFNGDLMQEVSDTISDKFRINDSIKDTYSTLTYPKICANAYYKLGKYHKFGFYSRNDITNGTIFPSFTLSYNLQLGRVLEAGVSYSMIHKNWANLGAGLALKLGAFQMYFASENVLSYFNAASAKNAYFHFGFNFVFGKWKEPLLDESRKSIEM